MRQFLTTENPLKMMDNVFNVKAPFIFEIFTFLSRLSGYVEKGLDKKAMVSFKIYVVTDWTTNDYNTHITKYLKK